MLRSRSFSTKNKSSLAIIIIIKFLYPLFEKKEIIYLSMERLYFTRKLRYNKAGTLEVIDLN